jgi:hypothetical protein
VIFEGYGMSDVVDVVGAGGKPGEMIAEIEEKIGINDNESTTRCFLIYCKIIVKQRNVGIIYNNRPGIKLNQSLKVQNWYSSILFLRTSTDISDGIPTVTKKQYRNYEQDEIKQFDSYSLSFICERFYCGCQAMYRTGEIETFPVVSFPYLIVPLLQFLLKADSP